MPSLPFTPRKIVGDFLNTRRDRLPRVPAHKNPDIDRYMDEIVSSAIDYIQKEADHNELRIFYFNLMSDNLFDNRDFYDIIEVIGDFISIKLSDDRFRGHVLDLIDESVELILMAHIGYQCHTFPELWDYMDNRVHRAIEEGIGTYRRVVEAIDKFERRYREESHRRYDRDDRYSDRHEENRRIRNYDDRYSRNRDYRDRDDRYDRRYERDRYERRESHRNDRYDRGGRYGNTNIYANRDDRPIDPRRDAALFGYGNQTTRLSAVEKLMTEREDLNRKRLEDMKRLREKGNRNDGRDRDYRRPNNDEVGRRFDDYEDRYNPANQQRNKERIDHPRERRNNTGSVWDKKPEHLERYRKEAPEELSQVQKFLYDRRDEVCLPEHRLQSDKWRNQPASEEALEARREEARIEAMAEEADRDWRKEGPIRGFDPVSDAIHDRVTTNHSAQTSNSKGKSYHVNIDDFKDADEYRAFVEKVIAENRQEDHDPLPKELRDLAIIEEHTFNKDGHTVKKRDEVGRVTTTHTPNRRSVTEGNRKAYKELTQKHKEIAKKVLARRNGESLQNKEPDMQQFDRIVVPARDKPHVWIPNPGNPHPFTFDSKTDLFFSVNPEKGTIAPKLAQKENMDYSKHEPIAYSKIPSYIGRYENAHLEVVHEDLIASLKENAQASDLENPNMVLRKLDLTSVVNRAYSMQEIFNKIDHDVLKREMEQSKDKGYDKVNATIAACALITPLLLSEDEFEIINKIRDMKSFEDIRIHILSNVDSIRTQILVQLDKYLTKSINRIIRHNLSIPQLAIETFLEDYQDLLQYLEKEYGRNYKEAIEIHQEDEINNLFKLDASSEIYVLSNLIRENDPVKPFVMSNSIKAMRIAEDIGTLDIDMMKDVSSLLLPSRHKLFDVITNVLFEDEDKYARFYIQTEDLKIIEASRSYLYKDAVLLRVLNQDSV